MSGQKSETALLKNRVLVVGLSWLLATWRYIAAILRIQQIASVDQKRLKLK